MLNGYPEEHELEKIRNWELQQAPQLIEYIRERWWMPDWGFKLDGNTLELHTGGWSGNESIIEALMESADGMFWGIYWKESRRGGHYYFDCDLVGEEMKWSKK